MIPLRDENPTRRFPWMTILLIATNAVVFLYEVTLSSVELESFVTTWAFVPSRYLAQPLAAEGIATVFAAMFMHAGPVHVAGNMLYLWIFGNNVEDRLGPLPFLVFYLACGVAATAAQTAVAPDSSIPTLGASGAVAAVLGAYLVLYPRAAVVTVIPVFFLLQVARLPAYLVIGFWFVLQLASGLASLGPSMLQAGGVAWFAHLGGFAAGVALMLPLASARSHRAEQRRWR